MSFFVQIYVNVDRLRRFYEFFAIVTLDKQGGTHRMAATLRVPDTDLYAIFERMSDGVLVVSSAGSVVYRNPTMSVLPDYLEPKVLDCHGPSECGSTKEQCCAPAEYSFLEGWTLSCHNVGSNVAYIFKHDDQLAERIEQLREDYSRQMTEGVPPAFAAMQVLRKFVSSRWIAIGQIDKTAKTVSFDVAFDGDKIRPAVLPTISLDDEMDFDNSIVVTENISRCFSDMEEAKALGIGHLIGVSLKNLHQDCVGFALLADDEEPKNLHQTVTLLQEVKTLFGPFFEADTAQSEAREAIEEAHTDVLTGKGNRRACEVYVQECLNDMAFEMQESEVLAMFDPNAMRNAIMMLVDFDGFKRINDEMGHEEGDRALRLVAQALSELDADSRVFRMGGDEFVQIFPKAETWESDILRLKINDIEQKMMLAGFDTIGLSMGVVHFFEGDGTLSSLMTLADARMYHDKRLRSVSFVELDL